MGIDMELEGVNIYNDERFKKIDIGEIMRVGHPDIIEGDQHIVQTIVSLRKKLNRPLRILDIGSGSGHLEVLLAKALPDCEVIANEVAPTPAAQARVKLEPFPNAKVFDKPFDQWTAELDVIISWGTHHHLAHDYLDQVKRLLSADGIFIVGDELCPEYLTADDQARLDNAEMIVIEGGYIFDNDHDIKEFKDSGFVPAWNQKLEDGRRLALWEWYKFVGDFAAAKGMWSVLISEIQIARDDIITDFADEHKTSAYLLERELKLAGLSIQEKMTIGDREPELQSFVVFTCKIA